MIKIAVQAKLTAVAILHGVSLISVILSLKCLCNEISPPTFYGLSVKITQNGLVTSFTEVHYFASFLRNFALNNMQGWIQQCFFRGVPGESSGKGARSLGGGGGGPGHSSLKILKIRTPETPFPAI